MQTLSLNSEQHLLPQLAQFIHDHANIHDLCPSEILCLLPNDFLISPLRQALQEKQSSQFLPFITTWREWHQSPHSNSVLANHQAQLLLAQLLKKHKKLYGKGSPWGLAANLIQLFNELSLQGLPRSVDWEQFKQQLSHQTSASSHPWFNREAELVFTLWQAWHQQMAEDQWTDASNAYALALGQVQDPRLQRYRCCIAIKPHRLYQAEYQWLQHVSDTMPLFLLDQDTSVLSRKRLYTAPCHSSEQQALAIAIATRDAIKQQQSVIIVGEDRRLTRRIHALLNRFYIDVDDKAGWTLSTTKIGTAIEYWLRCIESNFTYPHLLDLLKSPYCLSHIDNKTELVFRFEQDLVHHENIGADLSLYRRALKKRQLRAFSTETEIGQQLDDLLAQLEQAAQPLLALQQARAPHSGLHYIENLKDSLKQIGLLEYLQEDAAGQQVLKLLDEYESSNITHQEKLYWQEFHQWFNQALEGSYFRPSVQQPQAYLLNFQQAHSMDADMRIIYSADSDHLPPTPPRSPFFNQQTRLGLGLESKQQFQARYHHSFQRLIAAPGSCLISWQAVRDGEPIEPSQWLKQLEETHDLVLDKELLNRSQTALEEEQGSQYTASSAIAGDLLNKRYSAAAHQRLINCPYSYFATDLLKLKPLDEVREAMEKSDYGSRVHLCLEAFHRDIDYLPGPFPQTVNAANRHAAQELLEHIGDAVFKRDTINSFEHRSWLKRWRGLIAPYLSWEIQRQQHYRADRFEASVDYTLPQPIRIIGRIDRIDKNRDSQQLSLLDYKTGYSPTQREMQMGEDVQLSTYAFTLEYVEQCAYINLNSDKPPHERNGLQGEELTTTVIAVEKRLSQLHQAIEQGQALPAWGEQDICNRCNNAGICRRQIWSNS